MATSLMPDEFYDSVAYYLPLESLSGVRGATCGCPSGSFGSSWPPATSGRSECGEATGPSPVDRDKPDDGLVLAGPGVANQVDLACVRIVECGFVDDEDSVGAEQWLDLGSERRGVGFEAGEQAYEGVVGGGRGVSGAATWRPRRRSRPMGWR